MAGQVRKSIADDQSRLNAASRCEAPSSWSLHPQAALRYQDATNDRGTQIAHAVSQLATTRKTLPGTP